MKPSGPKKKTQTSLLRGIHAVKAALASDRSIEWVLIQKDLKNPRLFELLKVCRQKKIPVRLVPKHKLAAEAGQGHQGICAQASVKAYCSLESVLNKGKTPPLVVVPEGVEDPQNLGAIIRSAACAGANGIVLPATGSAGLTAGTAKAAAGCLEDMKIHRTRSMPATLETLSGQGIKTVGFEAGQGPVLWEADLTGPICLVFGGENKGIRPHIRRRLDLLAHIPAAPDAPSLNVSAAAAIVLFEVVRQRAG